MPKESNFVRLMRLVRAVIAIIGKKIRKRSCTYIGMSIFAASEGFPTNRLPLDIKAGTFSQSSIRMMIYPWEAMIESRLLRKTNAKAIAAT